MSFDDLHHVPRFPHAWLAFLVASQVLVALVWWHFGWHVGLPLMVASHLPFWWGTLVPDSRLFGPVLTRLPIDDKRIWLTIDDGPSHETLPMLDLLDAFGAKATFFIVAERARARPDAVREIVHRGHGIANHSATHPTRRFWRLPAAAMAREIESAQDTIASLTGQRPIWFRAVVGMANPFVSAPLKRLGLARVAWTARGFDGAFGDPQRVVARIQRKLRPGAIVLAHEGAPHGRNLEIMRALLQMLRDAGYSTLLPEQLVAVPVPEMHARDA